MTGTEQPRPSQSCYDLIKRWEGFRPHWYEDVAGIATIGYGFTDVLFEEINLSGIEGPISKTEGEELLRAAVRQHYLPKVSRVLDVRLTQNEIDALMSFVYNVGITAFERSTMLEEYNAGNDRAAEQEYMKWVYATDEETGEKRVIEGLKRRRREEQALAQEDEALLEKALAEEVEGLDPVPVAKGDPVGDEADTLA